MKNTKAAPHNSARAFGERFFVGPRFEKRRNTLCISNFSNRWIGEKYPAKAEGAIMRCCLILESVKKLEKLFIAPRARQILHETAQRAFARCECA